MPKRIYVGGSAAVEVALPDGTVVEVKKGEAAEFPEDMCKEMDVSEAWASHKSTTTPKES